MAGPWEKYGAQPQQGNVFALPPTPEEVERAKRAAQAQEIQRQRMEADIAAREEANRLAREKFEYEKSVKGATGAGQFPKITAKVRQDALDAYNDADALERIASDLEGQFNDTIGKTKGISGFQDYLPTGTNKRFDDTSFQARGYVKSALGFTGGEGNTIGEIGLNYGPYLPEAGDRDEQIVGKIAALRSLAADARKKSIATLGGAPDANGTVTPTQGDNLPNAMTATRTVGGDPLQAAAFGATTGVDQYPPEMLQAHEALVGRMLMQGGGKLDPQVYAAERAKIDQQFGFATNGESNAAWAKGINDYLGKGGKSVPTDIKPPERDLSTTEMIRNSVVNNPFGAAATGYTDAVGMGGVSLLDKAFNDGGYGALSEAQPLPMLAGQIGGSIMGAGLLGKGVGLATKGAITPRMAALARMKLGKDGVRLAKDAGTDALYSGVVGTAQGGDPTTSAALGAGGSLLGRGVGKTLGTAAEGVKVSAPVQYLRDRNIPLTVGQTLGGFAKGMEDAATSIPLVGDMIGRRYTDSLRGLSTAAADDVGASIGYKAPRGEFGRELTGDMGDAISEYYTNTVQGANVPLDGQYGADFANVAALGQKLPDDLRGKFGLALNNRVNPINDAGYMTGETYQQAQRGLKAYKGEHVKAGFEGDYRDGLSAAQQALRDQMARGGGAAVAEGLDNADQAYRLFKTFENATQRADGAGYLPTASQLQDAVKATGRKFPGKNPLLDLADNAQEVLPSKVPDSGTARRMIQAGIGATALGGAQASDSYLGTDLINPYTIGALALLTAGGTAKGQKALTKALVDRPQALKTTGKWINTRRGLFGRAAIPLALDWQRQAEAN